MVEDLVKAVQEQKLFCTGTTTEIRGGIKQLTTDVGRLSKSLAGNGGKSIPTRLELIEQRLGAIESRQRLRLAFWAPIIAAAITSLVALVVALRNSHP